MSFPPTLSITDFEKTKNGTEHRTKDIWGKELILRRGQSFGVKLLFRCRGKDEKLENLNFTAQLVSCPSVANIQFPVSKLKDKKSWSAQVESGDHLSALSITICSPASAYIGRYSLCLHGMYGGTSQTFSLGDIILLFNPWCPDDDVFLDNEKLRQEYVMNEHGFMYTGNKDCIQSMPWNFGQFEDGVGDICLKILDMSPQFLNDPSTDCSKRGDPVYISRIISAMINSNDDRGVVESCWEEFFRNGANPSTWNGSVTILRLWKKSGCRAVRYGQCWVLAGVMCTVFRFLGIPTRVVTNFESAHDSNCNLTVDEYYDETGRKLKAAAGDSVWNFHVWDECWMARKDLRPGYDGWQVLDATPQELSGGTYCCGPASVKAVKEGDLEVPYDVPFVYAEVNGDSIHWLLREEGVEKLKIDTGAIGKHISTKSVGTNDRDDITDLYKYREGSYQERSIFEKAASKMNTGHPNTSRVPEVSRDYDVFLNLEDSPLVGKTINLLFRVCNKTFEAKTFSVNASAQVMQYNGTPLDQFWKESYDMQVNANSATDKSFQINSYEYHRYVRSGNNIRVTALATDMKSKKIKFAAKNIIFCAPTIDIEVGCTPVLNERLSVALSISNPFNDILSSCVMTAEGTGLFPDGPVTVYMDQIFPHRSGYVKIFCMPYKSGERQLEVNFSCDKIKHVKGSKTIHVPQ